MVNQVLFSVFRTHLFLDHCISFGYETDYLAFLKSLINQRELYLEVGA